MASLTINAIIQSIKDTLKKEVLRAGTGIEVDENMENTKLNNELNFHDHSVMIFVNGCQTAEKLAAALRQRHIECTEYHGEVKHLRNPENLSAFRRGIERILVCTDIAARGLDIPSVRHVIQAELAENLLDYHHRVGRASRAGRIGYASVFYAPNRANDVRKLMRKLENLSETVDSFEQRKWAAKMERRRLREEDRLGLLLMLMMYE